ncbi:hypothetical protein DPMN_125260 [Dreissena polymorpha]|uniref:Uncharacterized protein n=1 Tax=Dreissena polymorpha TaxID=45954 RepID=A0A9D4JUJ0_DREPO|nr:hypothetical protein DPMN_125260 [Dreissena polymorpha]
MMDVPNIVSEKVNKTALKRKRKSSLWLHQPKKKLNSAKKTYLQSTFHINKLTKFGTHFAKPTRLGKRQRKSKRSDISRPHEVARGCLPIRSHREFDEPKILPTTRLGITLEDTMKV